MKKALSFAIALGFVVVLGCSTLSDKDQKMVKDAVEIAEAIDPSWETARSNG